MKVYISPSDQVGNLYSYGNTNESEQCRAIGAILHEYLRRAGCDAKLAKEGLTYQERTAESNSWGADIHMCIHTNAGGGDGTVVFCHPNSVDNTYVISVYNELADISPGKDDGIRPVSNLYEINNSNCLCIYCEVEFHDNPAGAKWIIENKDLIARAICAGLGFSYDVPFQPECCEYVVQAGAFEDYKKADVVVSALKQHLISAFRWFDSGTELWKVQAGVFYEKKNAENVVAEIKKLGIDAYYYVR